MQEIELIYNFTLKKKNTEPLEVQSAPSSSHHVIITPLYTLVLKGIRNIFVPTSLTGKLFHNFTSLTTKTVLLVSRFNCIHDCFILICPFANIALQLQHFFCFVSHFPYMSLQLTSLQMYDLAPHSSEFHLISTTPGPKFIQFFLSDRLLLFRVLSSLYFTSTHLLFGTMILTKIPKKITQKTSPQKLYCNLPLHLKLSSVSCSSQTFTSLFTRFATFFLMSIISNFPQRCQITYTTTGQLEESNCILLYRK